MSRIEKALEKASQVRNQTPDASQVKSEPLSRLSPDLTSGEFPFKPVTAAISSPLLVSVTDSSSPITEEYRKLKSFLVGMARQREFANVIMVTSALAGEGKTITTLNLALSLAQEMDHTVLLVDADLRKPMIHKYLGIEAGTGLAEVLENRGDIPDSLIHTGVGKLVVLPAGTATLNPVELFTSQRMVKVMQEIKHRYPDRFVIIDTPPILPFAETRTLSHLVDGVIFVIKERLASHSRIEEALNSLEGVNKIGIVYNEAEIVVTDERYSHYYSYYQNQSV